MSKLIFLFSDKKPWAEAVADSSKTFKGDFTTIILMKTIITIIILGGGFYFSKNSLSGIPRTVVAGRTLSTCAIVWLIAFAPYAPNRIAVLLYPHT